MRLQNFNAIPDVVRDVELFPAQGKISIIVPEETTNLITQPSAEVANSAWVAGAGTLTRVSTNQYKGVYSFQYTPTTSVNDGVYYTPLSLTINNFYTAQVKFKGAPGIPYKIYFATSAGTLIGTETRFTGNGAWQHIEVTHYDTVGASTRRLYITKDNSASVAPFLFDAVQVENKAYSTIYCDGDQGFGHSWLGLPDQSQSFRASFSRTGGKEVFFDEFNFHINGLVGLTAAPIQHQIISLSDGSDIYQQTLRLNREFTITGQFNGLSYPNLRGSISSFINRIKHDAVSPDQPMILVYHSNIPGKYPIYIPCIYVTGLEGNIESLLQENVAIQFRTIGFPYSEKQSGSVLSMSETVAESDGIIVREREGNWRALGTGITGGTVAVKAIQWGQDGKLYVGGDYTEMGGVGDTWGIARYNFISELWESISDDSISSRQVRSLRIGPGTVVYAGGGFVAINGVTVNHIAKFDIATGIWSAMATGLGSVSVVYDIDIDQSGNIIAFGDSGIYKFNGVSWTQFGTPNSGLVFGGCVAPDGKIYAVGSFNTMNSIVGTNSIAFYDGTNWNPLQSGLTSDNIGKIRAKSNGLLYTGDISGLGEVQLKEWNGFSLNTIIPRSNQAGALYMVSVDSIGNLFISGSAFDSWGGVSLPDHVAVWNGTAFRPVSINLPSSAIVYDVKESPDGRLALGFDTSGSAVAEALTVITNNAEVPSSVKFIFVGPGRLYSVINNTTRKGIFFNLLLNSGEIAVLDIRPGMNSFSSNFRPNLLSTVIPGSNLSEFLLQPGENNITVLITGTDSGSSARAYWSELLNGISS